MNQQAFKLATLVAAVALAAGAGGYWLARKQANAPTQAGSATQDNRKALYWYDPMVPNQHFDKPGKSPFMDMQLVPKYADEGGDAASVKIDPSVVQNLGVRLATVENTSLSEAVTVAGSIMLNDRQLTVLQARSSAFVERVHARAPGDVVKRGAPIADLLVPEWAGAQTEFLALQNSGDKSLADAARNRLLLLGMPAGLIEQVARTGKVQRVITVTAPVGGVIQTLDARQGMALPAGATIAKINGLDSVWLEAAVPEAQAGRIATGQPIETMLAAYPGEIFKGKVLAVLPETNPDSRTLRVRVELTNRDGRLKPGMFAQVRLEAGSRRTALLIPSEAVIRTGQRNVVLLALDGGKFQPVEVRIGREAGGKTEIQSGLSAGQKVVASSQFLIDSEASLKGTLARMGTGDASSPAAAKPAAAAPYQTTGKVEAIANGEITLSHQPVPVLGWGAMTMPFKLAQPTLANGIKPGDTVSFAFSKQGGAFVIEQLSKSGGKQ